MLWDLPSSRVALLLNTVELLYFVLYCLRQHLSTGCKCDFSLSCSLVFASTIWHVITSYMKMYLSSWWKYTEIVACLLFSSKFTEAKRCLRDLITGSCPNDTRTSSLEFAIVFDDYNPFCQGNTDQGTSNLKIASFQILFAKGERVFIYIAFWLAYWRLAPKPNPYPRSLSLCFDYKGKGWGGMCLCNTPSRMLRQAN